MNYLNKIKTTNATFLSNSIFTQKHLSSWGIKSKTLYPYVDKVFFEKNMNLKREKIVLSVGRFFESLHTKNHNAMIDLFKTFSRNILKDYKLVLAGGLKDEDNNYFNDLQKKVKDDPNIILKPDVPFNELLALYNKAEIYWHLGGFGIDENKHPEKTEHLGLTPLEAMASSCLCFCYNAGGVKEFMRDGENGFLFNSEKELKEKLTEVLNNSELKNKIQTQARGFVMENFGYEAFQKKAQAILFNS